MLVCLVQTHYKHTKSSFLPLPQSLRLNILKGASPSKCLVILLNTSTNFAAVQGEGVACVVSAFSFY